MQYQHEHDPMESAMVDVGTPGLHEEPDFDPADEYMPGVDDDEVNDTTYVLHYVSADNAAENSTWSVYVEEYRNFKDDVPIEDSQRWVSTHATEVEAYTVADRLQAKANRPQ